MKVLASVCIIAAFCVVASLQDTPFSPCDREMFGPLPTSLRVEGCNSSPCNVQRGSNLKAQWDFVANANAVTLRPLVKVTIGQIKVLFPYPRQDACKDLEKGDCPFRKGDELTYNLLMPIKKTYPLVRMSIEFALRDENANVQVCFKMDGRVVDKLYVAQIEENVV